MGCILFKIEPTAPGSTNVSEFNREAEMKYTNGIMLNDGVKNQYAWDLIKLLDKYSLTVFDIVWVGTSECKYDNVIEFLNEDANRVFNYLNQYGSTLVAVTNSGRWFRLMRYARKFQWQSYREPVCPAKTGDPLEPPENTNQMGANHG
jgi:hypothetical protein